MHDAPSSIVYTKHGKTNPMDLISPVQELCDG